MANVCLWWVVYVCKQSHGKCEMSVSGVEEGAGDHVNKKVTFVMELGGRM